jgi:hypothetical protein
VLRGCGWPLWACIVTYPLAGLGRSRGPSFLSSGVVSTIRSPVTSSDFSCRVPPDFGSRLIPAVSVDVGHGRQETSRVPRPAVTAFRPPYAEEFFEAARPESSPLPWPSPGMNGSALLCPLRVTITALQGSRPVADSCVAPPSRRDTPLQHPRSPKSTGSLLRGSLAMTTTGLSPASRQ